jgi:hypothetical protein
MPETINLTTALEIFSDCHQEIRKACLDNMSEIDSQYQPYKKLEDDVEFTIEAIHKHVNYLQVKEKTENYIKTIKRIDILSKPARNGSVTADTIARAKEVPIENLYGGRLFGRDDKVGLCPFHQERTPSFHINTKKNNWRCFGCDAFGDSIDYLMKQDNLTFIEAVKKLTQ